MSPEPPRQPPGPVRDARRQASRAADCRTEAPLPARAQPARAAREGAGPAGLTPAAARARVRALPLRLLFSGHPRRLLAPASFLHTLFHPARAPLPRLAAAAALALALVLAALLPQGAAAQQAGPLLTFGISQSLSHTSNPGLTIPAEKAATRADTALRLGFFAETPLQQFSLDTSATLRGERRAGSTSEFELQNPAASLSYHRLGASSSFRFSAFHRSSRLDERMLLALDPEALESGIIGPEDLLLLYERGTQRSSGARAGLSWGEGGPLSGSFSLGATRTAYSGTSDPSLVDNRTLTASLGLRAVLDPLTTLGMDLGWRRYAREGAGFADEDSHSLGLRLSRELPRGQVWVRLSASHDQDGTRHGLGFGHALELPDGSLSTELGLSRSPAGKTETTGALSYGKELPTGRISLQLSRGLSHDSANRTTTLTALSAGWQQALSELMGMGLSARWSRSEVAATGITTDTGILDASLNWRLTEDWGLNLGATHRLRHRDGEGRASSNGVYLSLARSFEWRP